MTPLRLTNEGDVLKAAMLLTGICNGNMVVIK